MSPSPMTAAGRHAAETDCAPKWDDDRRPRAHDRCRVRELETSLVVENPHRRWVEDGGEQLDLVERVLGVLACLPPAEEERLQRLCREMRHPVAVDAAHPAALHLVADRVEHAEPHGSVCTITSATPGSAPRIRSSTPLA